MKKNWVYKSDASYELVEDESVVISLSVAVNTARSVGEWRMGDAQGRIQYKGFWRTQIELLDDQGNILLSAKPEKWYGTTQIVDYKGRSLRLVTRNNPLAEVCLQENGEDVLAYSLETINKKMSLRIRQKPYFHDPLLDALLWYLFRPIAQEQGGMDVATFLLLVS